MRVLRWVLLSLLLLLLLALASGWIYTSRARPQVEGNLSVRGPLAELRIERDEHGIPTIRAASAEDAWFGLGFAHAQDRLWQLETHRRIGAGRLAEAFGPNALEADKFLRALGVRRAAAEQWVKADAGTRRALEAYAAGINAVLRQHLPARPPEFVLLGIKPEDWSPVDSLAWATMMAWDLGGNWNSELLRLRLAERMPVERVGQLLPPYPGDEPLPVRDYASLYKRLGVHGDGAPAALAAASPWLDRLLGDAGVEGAGSNNWVVDGAHSTSGQPLLANDPHLKLSAPALWYFARLEAPGLRVAGATMPGLPMVVLGQNEQIAWGFTNTGPDVQDLYLEKIDPADPQRYLESREGNRWARFERFDELIKVKGAPDVAFTARRSRHGPLISDAGAPATAGLTGQDGQRYAIAMRWTALDPDASAVAAGIAFNRAHSVEEFISASARYVAPMQNMVVADRDRIAFVAAGRVPVRRADNDLGGLAPAPGWEPRYDWEGYLPANRTPREIAPARGWIATANQRIHDDSYPHYIGSEWALPYRQQRIEALLRARPQHDVASLRAIQLDQVSLATQKLLPLLRAARSKHPLAAAAQAELRAFEADMQADHAAPLIAWAWVRELTRGVFADDVGEALYERQLANRSFRDALEAVLERDDASWCDELHTPAVETCADQADAAFDRALVQLAARHGSDVAKWRWGDAHQARSEHRPFSKVPLLARLFELRVPVGGDTYTVNVSRVALKPDPGTGELFLDEHGPSLRAIYDLGDPSKSRFMHSSGQSGLFFEPGYRNMVAGWARGEDLPVWGDGASEPRVLTLTPR
ncbi:penicillin acylase family protein [Rivibacter subsaxonicus]|uniref:Penicillin amidase n=1 Tax=Rivibacter subsaxonicus TaxID=457575 RepID=A0A4Q7VA46_9BURK|nr:penicillin acylase family protein [Rivibacter subsaxonicus]RZT93636.1 penicillin amidase [Rivibacter subsaxonicus]